MRDYLAGSTSEVEKQVDLITSRQDIPMVDVAGTLTEVSRQRWAMLNPLLAGDSHQSGMFANVERVNGIEACRWIAEPINEDKAHVRRDGIDLDEAAATRKQLQL